MDKEQDKNLAADIVAANGTKVKWLRTLAAIVSYVFHPMFMPAAMAAVLYKLDTTGFIAVSSNQFVRWLAAIAINTIVFPLVLVLLLKGLGFIQSIYMRTSKERIIPLIGSMVFYFWANLVFKNQPDVPMTLRVLMLGAYWGIIVLFLTNIFFKVSMHTMAAGGMLGVLTVLLISSPVGMIVPLFIAIVIAGVIGTSRMLLGAHNQSQIWIGYVLGFAVQMAAYIYVL